MKLFVWPFRTWLSSPFSTYVSISRPWPTVDPLALVQDSIELVVQVNGKVRDRLEVRPDISEDELREMALAAPGVIRALGGQSIRKVIVRAPKLVNVVAG